MYELWIYSFDLFYYFDKFDFKFDTMLFESKYFSGFKLSKIFERLQMIILINCNLKMILRIICENREVL